MDKVIIRNARLSYCNVFQKGSFEGKENTKFDCTMLFPKADVETKEKIRQMAVKALIDKYGSKEKIPKQFKQMVDREKFGDSDRTFLRDGDNTDDDAAQGMWTVKGANAMKPTTLKLDKSEASEDDGLIYSGSYADVQISCWIQDNSWGKRINANLLGLRFRNHGDPLGGGGGRAAVDDFDDLDDVESVDDLDDMDL